MSGVIALPPLLWHRAPQRSISRRQSGPKTACARGRGPGHTMNSVSAIDYLQTTYVLPILS